jgi:IS5 family transposase
MEQMQLVSLDQLIPADHSYRKYKEVWNFKPVFKELKRIKKANPHEGYGLDRLFLCLLLQFLENVSDRELERFIRENVTARWFCGFSLLDKTPDHTVFTRARDRIGTQRMSKIFSILRDQLRIKGYMNEVFSFVDASHLIAKSQLWKERDEAIRQKYEKLNNETLPKVAHDKEARIGCKGTNKFWYGYKKHVSVDMQSGCVNKVAITPANLPDAKGLKHVCPSQGSIFADKGYCVGDAPQAAARRGCHLAAVKKNNMKDKNKELDKWYSKMRAPYERIFSNVRKRVRYCGVVKNQFAAFMEAIAINTKRCVVLGRCPN